MKKKDSEDNFIVNSIIGEGAEFKGEFKLSGVIRIDGVFSGLLESKGKVLIGKSGKVDTDIRADVIIVGGTVNGNLYATERVELLETGIVSGDIITPRLMVEEGVKFTGKCTINQTT